MNIDNEIEKKVKKEIKKEIDYRIKEVKYWKEVAWKLEQAKEQAVLSERKRIEEVVENTDWYKLFSVYRDKMLKGNFRLIKEDEVNEIIIKQLKSKVSE